MRIHPRLKENVELNPTKESSQENLDLLCQKIDSRVITLPLYQRDLSWTTQKSVDLLNYQLSGKSPVSAISINVIDEVSDSVAVPQVTFINRELVDLKSGMHSVVDGQQRLTTNYAAYEVIMGTPHSNNYCPMASDVRVNAICSMKASQILLSFKYTLDALDKVIDFIENNDLDIPSRIDYINFLIGYFVFYQREDKVDEQFLINWYNTVNFSNSSNTERRKIYSKLLSKTL